MHSGNTSTTVHLASLRCLSHGLPEQAEGVAELRRGTARVLQLNVGLYCNQACSHCHVDSSPLRTETMDRCGLPSGWHVV